MFLPDATDTGGATVYVAVGSLVGVVVSALTAALVTYMRARHDIAKDDTRTTLVEYRKLMRAYEVRIERLESRASELEEEILKCRKAHHAESLMRLRILARMEQYEMLLRKNGVEFSPFESDADKAEGEQP